MSKEKLTELEHLALRFLSELGPTHPYRLGRELEDRGGKGVVSLGALYKAMHRLESDGCVKAKWEDIDPKERKRPARCIYEITGLGERMLQEAAVARELLFGLTPRRAT